MTVSIVAKILNHTLHMPIMTREEAESVLIDLEINKIADKDKLKTATNDKVIAS